MCARESWPKQRKTEVESRSDVGIKAGWVAWAWQADDRHPRRWRRRWRRGARNCATLLIDVIGALLVLVLGRTERAETTSLVEAHP
jgi:hypothetical protein